MTIKLYVRANCPYCDAARQALEASGDAYEEIDIHASPEAEAQLIELTGGDAAVPVLVEADGEVRIGFGGV